MSGDTCLGIALSLVGGQGLKGGLMHRSLMRMGNCPLNNPGRPEVRYNLINSLTEEILGEEGEEEPNQGGEEEVSLGAG